MCDVVFLMLLMYKKLYGIHSYIMNEVRFCPVLSGVLSSLVLSRGVLSVWGFVPWGFVSVGFCPVGFCQCGALSVHHETHKEKQNSFHLW